MAKHPISPFYKLIGADYNTWIELINLLRATAKEHERTLPPGIIYDTAIELEKKELNGCLCAWYTLDAHLRVDKVVMIQRMLHLSKVYPGLAPIWSMSFGFDQNLIPDNALDPDYQRFVRDVFESSIGRMGPKLSSVSGGSFGYFARAVGGTSSIDGKCNLQIVGLNPPDNTLPQRRIARLEQAAWVVYNSPPGANQFWEAKAFLASYKHPYDFWGGVGRDCNITTLTLLEQNPPGPR